MSRSDLRQGCDFITVVTMDAPTGKLYQMMGGKLKKTPAANNANGWAVTHYIPTTSELAALIETISTNPHCAIVLGYIAATRPDINQTEGVRYRLMSASAFEVFRAGHPGASGDKFAHEPIEDKGVLVATRTKRMFSASSWFGFDRDAVVGMPAELEPNATFDRWWELMVTMLPEIKGCSYVAIKSASSRVSYDGVSMSKGNTHVYMQAQEAGDCERFGKAGMIHSFSRGYGFMRPVLDRITGSVIGRRPWTLYDPTTFSRERLFFDGSPILDPLDPSVVMGRLRIAPTTPYVYKGTTQRVNTRTLETPTKLDQTSLGLEFNVDGRGRATVVNITDLTPDIEFEYHDRSTGERGSMTMQEFVDGDVDRLSCQSVFRPDSTSFAAYVSKEDGCHPFMYDVGTNVNYKYSNAKSMFANAILTGVIETVVGCDRVNSAAGVDFEPELLVPPPKPKPPSSPSSPSALIGLPNDVNSPEYQLEQKKPIVIDGGTGEVFKGEPFGQRASVSNVIYGSTYDATQMSCMFAESDLGNAQRFAWTFDNELKYVPAAKAWFKWQTARWFKCECDEARRAAQVVALEMAKAATQLSDDDSMVKWTKSTLSSRGISAMVREAAVMPKMVMPLCDMDREWFYFGVNNGYIDLRIAVDSSVSGANDAQTLVGFKPPTRELFISKGNDIDYDVDAKCPMWEKALWNIFSYDQALIDFFRIFVGYTMTGNPHHEVLAFLVGNGSNGKSTITGVLEKVFGDYKVTVDKAVLMSKRSGSDGGQAASPALARLKGMRFAVVTETKEGDVIDESVIKALSGSDTITARHLNCEPFEFDAAFVSWIATNHPPNIRAVDDGTWRRVMQFPFKRNFLKENGRAKLDVGLKRRLIDTELPGILNWCIEGVRQYHIKGLVPPQSVIAATESYRDTQDIISDWMSECIEYAPDFECTNAQLWLSYVNYSKVRGDQIINHGRTLNAKLSAKGFSKKRHIAGDNSARGFSGLRVKFSTPE